jgi:tetratricopeptide (TPR) repeat protein
MTYELKERVGPISLSAEWLNTKNAINGLLADVRKNPKNNMAKLNLVQAYIQESRITGEHSYYDQAALNLLKEILKSEPANFDALCCKATVLLSQHHFSEALSVALEAQKINPYSAFVYGLLCDANVELGNYKEAVENTDKMISIRPDNRSYARVSYLREIHGETQGAIEAMKMAVKAGYPGLEQTAWTRVNLGRLYENIGDIANAEVQYQIALIERPDYPYAIAGLGRIAKAKANYKSAINYFEQAKRVVVDPAFDEELIDLYKIANQPERLNESAQNIIELLGEETNKDENLPHGHYSDKELAYTYLKIFKYELALKHAKLEYERRPNNIEAAEVLAWVHYKRGEFNNANKYIDIALKTNCQNSELLCRAGLIKSKTNDKSKGVSLIRKSLELNPFMDYLMRTEAKIVLASSSDISLK